VLEKGISPRLSPKKKSRTHFQLLTAQFVDGVSDVKSDGKTMTIFHVLHSSRRHK